MKKKMLSENRIINLIFKKKEFSLLSSGTSMLPMLRHNDLVYYKRSVKKIHINDLVLIKKNNNFFTHRVIYKMKEYSITKGDNNLESDGKIYSKQIVGKVDYIKRNDQIINHESLYLVQSTLYFQEIVKIKQAFEKKNIDHVFLKGLPLHLYYEKTHPKRIYADCDVLIKKQDFLKAEKVVKKFGYKKIAEKEKRVENNYVKVINGFIVIFDIHLESAFLMTQLSGLEALYPQKLINNLTNELIETKKQIKINNEPFFILNTKYLILYLALHLFHHNFRGAFRLDFLDKVIRKSRLSANDWNNIASKINNYQLDNFISPVFVLLKKYYNTPLPRSFTSTMNRYSQINIFDDEPRLTAGINRFKLIFLLSSRPLWRKVFVFTNFEVIYTIFWSLGKKLSSFFSNQRVIHSNPKAKV